MNDPIIFKGRDRNWSVEFELKIKEGKKGEFLVLEAYLTKGGVREGKYPLMNTSNFGATLLLENAHALLRSMAFMTDWTEAQREGRPPPAPPAHETKEPEHKEDPPAADPFDF